jgi:hypothetical protein
MIRAEKIAVEDDESSCDYFVSTDMRFERVTHIACIYIVLFHMTPHNPEDGGMLYK